VNRKYELLQDDTKEFFGVTLYRIRALIEFNGIKVGELGGYIATEKNLDHSGNAWVSDNARVYGNARVSDNARVKTSFDYLCLGPIGSRCAFTTFMRSKDGGVIVACGCFTGTLEDFEARVQQVHGKDEHGQTYAAAIAFARTMLPPQEVTAC